MTVQGMIPAGKNPFGLQPVGKAKTKADGNPADPGFASLLATLVVPAIPPAPGLIAVAGGGEGPPAGTPDSAASVLFSPMGTEPVVPNLNPNLLAGGAAVPAAFPPPGEGTPPDPAGLSAMAGALEGTVVADPGGVQVVMPELPGVTAELPGIPTAELQAGPVETQVSPPTVGAEPAAAVAPALASAPDREGQLPTVEESPEESAPPVAAVPTDAAQGKETEKKANEHRSNPDLARGLGRTALVSEGRERRTVETPNADRFSVPPATTGPAPGVDAVADSPDPLPASLEGLRSNPHEAPRLMEAIARAITSTQDGQYKVTLRLHPEHLGEVRLQLQLSGREVHTVMEVASPEARQALESRGDQLRQNLTDAGLTLSGFEVSTGQNRQTARDQREALEEQLRGQMAGTNRRTGSAAAPPTDAIDRIRSAGRRSGRLDTMA